MLLCFAQNYQLLTSKNKLILFTEVNQILLKIRGKGESKIINPNFKFKPYIYYLNDEQIPKKFKESSIDLPESENIVKLIFDDKATDCKSMFSGCSNITEIDLRYFISSNIKHINSMFYGCNSLNKIRFGNFQTSQVGYMEKVFYNCFSLKTLDLSSFDTSIVTHLHEMFYGCSSLKYLDLSNFDTSSVVCTHNMFNGCTSIISIDLSSFDISKVTIMYYMFNNCKNLISLDLSSFEFDKLSDMRFLFNNCKKLEFVNLNKTSISCIKTYSNMITNTAKNIVFCVDESKTPILNQQMGSNSCSSRISGCSNWRKDQNKIV